MDTAHAAATIIARARAGHGSADMFDFKIATEGVEPFGELYNEAYLLANEGEPMVKEGDGEDVLAGRKTRAAELWERVLPELEAYATRCREARYTGWSRESGGPVRRVG